MGNCCTTDETLKQTLEQVKLSKKRTQAIRVHKELSGELSDTLSLRPVPEMNELHQMAQKALRDLPPFKAQKNAHNGSQAPQRDPLHASDRPVVGPVAISPLNHTYKGQMKNGVFEGFGTMIYCTGAIYEGEFRSGERSGRGRYVDTIGEVYEGDWLNDKRHGSGRTTALDGTYYEGGWVEDEQDGVGVEGYVEGNVYEGEFLKGKRHGVGVFRFKNGSVYEGGFKDDLYNGAGEF